MREFFYVCLNRDLEEGKFRCIKLFGSDVLIAKKDGKILAAPNICPHRGSPLATPTRGISNIALYDLPIKCPYHGLSFNFEKTEPVTEVGEFIFMNNTNSEFESDLHAIGNDLGKEFGWHEMQVKAPFHLWIQNTADPNHLKTIHGETFAKLFRDFIPHEEKISEDRMVSSYRMNVKYDIAKRYMKYKTKDFRSDFFHMIVFPHLSITSFLNIFYSIETAVQDGEWTNITTRFFTSKNANIPKLLCKMALEANIKVLEEDRFIVNWWAEGQYEKIPSVILPGENRIHEYRKALYLQKQGVT